MKRILVTGGAGYIGAVLAEMLVERGYDVRVLDRLYWGEGPLAKLREHVEIIRGDVRSMSDDLLDGVDGVVHMAGLSNDPTAEYNPAANWEMNTVATKALAEACKRRGIERLTFGSSCSIYDGLPHGQGVRRDDGRAAARRLRDVEEGRRGRAAGARPTTASSR